MVYMVEAGKKNDMKGHTPANAVLYTPCGLQTLANDQPQITKYLSVNGNHEGDGVTTINVPDLQPNTHYIVTIVAVCDENYENTNEIQGSV